MRTKEYEIISAYELKRLLLYKFLTVEQRTRIIKVIRYHRIKNKELLDKLPKSPIGKLAMYYIKHKNKSKTHYITRHHGYIEWDLLEVIKTGFDILKAIDKSVKNDKYIERKYGEYLRKI